MIHFIPTPSDTEGKAANLVFAPAAVATSATFEVGKVYYTRSICDYDCIFRFKVLKRTAKTVTIQNANCPSDAIKRKGVFTWDGVEQFKPFGTYSMCAVIGADSPS